MAVELEKYQRVLGASDQRVKIRCQASQEAQRSRCCCLLFCRVASGRAAPTTPCVRMSMGRVASPLEAYHGACRRRYAGSGPTCPDGPPPHLN